MSKDDNKFADVPPLNDPLPDAYHGELPASKHKLPQQYILMFIFAGIMLLLMVGLGFSLGTTNHTASYSDTNYQRYQIASYPEATETNGEDVQVILSCSPSCVETNNMVVLWDNPDLSGIQASKVMSGTTATMLYSESNAYLVQISTGQTGWVGANNAIIK